MTAPAANGSVPAAEVREVLDDVLEAAKSPGAMERMISAPVGRDARVDVRPLRRLRLPGPQLGSRLGHRTGVRGARRADRAVDEFARSALTPEMRDGDTFKEATVAPEGASPIERLVAFSGRSV